ISPSRTPWRRPIGSVARCATGGEPRAILRMCEAGAFFPRALRHPRQSSTPTMFRTDCWQAARLPRRPGLDPCWTAGQSCGEFLLEESVSDSGLSSAARSAAAAPEVFLGRSLLPARRGGGRHYREVI